MSQSSELQSATEETLVLCPLCDEPLTRLMNGLAYCNNFKKDFASIDDWKSGSCMMAQHNVQLPTHVWQALRARISPPSAAPVVDNLQRRLYQECVTANWDPERKNTFAEEIAHLHEELSEAFRAWRNYKDCKIREVNGKLEGVPIEFADALIGMFYNAELHGFDLMAAIERKHQFNLRRNYVAEGRQLHAGHPPQKVGIIRLYDRADGVKGHYCIGRLRTDGTNEFWNEDKFCSAGEVFIGKESAEAKLRELAAATAAPVEQSDEDLPLITENPFEQIVERALIKAGIVYQTDHDGSNPARLDFYLPKYNVHIEVKTMHSERVAEQMSRAANVVVAQGGAAIEFLAQRIESHSRLSSTSASAAAEEIVKSWLWHTSEPNQDRASKSIQHIIGRHCFPGASKSLLTKIATIADIGGAAEFSGALERLQSIRRLIDEHEGAC